MDDFILHAEEGSRISVTEYDPGKLMLSVSLQGAYCSTVINAQEARELAEYLLERIGEVA